MRDIYSIYSPFQSFLNSTYQFKTKNLFCLPCLTLKILFYLNFNILIFCVCTFENLKPEALLQEMCLTYFHSRYRSSNF